MEPVYLKAMMCIWGIFWNVLITISIFNDAVLRKSSTFLLLSSHFLACSIDVGSRLVFDVPSEILNRPFFRLSENYDDFPTKLFHFITYSGWFFQLYTLIAIAFSHILAVYASFAYQRITPKKTIHVILVILIASMISVFYLWSNEFVIKFFPEFWGWSEDRAKPLVRFFFYFNYVIQGIVFACLFLADILIIYKIGKVKSQLGKKTHNVTITNGNQGTLVNNRFKISTELKVSINFIIVSLFLLTQTLIYIVCPLYDTELSFFLLFIAPIFRGSKCLAYLVSGSVLRKAVFNLLLCKKSI